MRAIMPIVKAPRMRLGHRLAAVVGVVSGTVALSLAPAAPAVAANGVPHFDHVVVLIEENEGYSSTFSNVSPATYLNKTLVPEGTLDDQYFGTGHVSLDNYIAMTSGQPSNVISNTDCLTFNLFACVQPQAAFSSGRHVGDQLDDYKISWKQYADGTTKPCVHDSYSPVATPPTTTRATARRRPTTARARITPTATSPSSTTRTSSAIRAVVRRI